MHNELEASTDLTSWEPFAVVENLNGDVILAAPEFDQFDRRFYRIRNIE